MSKNRTLTMGYSLRILKIGGSWIRNITCQARRVGHTEDTHTINPCNGYSCE